MMNVTDFFVPELLAEQVVAGLAGMKALYGTDAAIINTSMPHGLSMVGTAVKIPYFTNIGELDDITNDGDALTPGTIGSSVTTATVLHSGKAFEITQWAEWAALGDPYAICSAQIVEACKRRIDKVLIDTADSSSGSPLTYDATGVGSGQITYDAVVNAKMQWGDEQDAISLMVVHSKVFLDMLSLKDSTGRPLVTDITEGGISKFLGIPVLVSDRIKVSGSGPDSAIYYNLIVKKGGLVAWVNGSPLVMQLPDPLTGANVTGVHIFYTAHRYSPMAGLTKMGVVILETKAST